jgi:hypothetical protein
MRPGDVVTCQACGASAVATFSGPRFEEGFPCALRWTHRGTPRTEVTAHRPELCLPCHERQGSVGEPWPRLTPDELARQDAYASTPAPLSTPAPRRAAPSAQLSFL